MNNEMKELRRDVNDVTNIMLYQWVKIFLVIAAVGGIISGIGWLVWPAQKKIERAVFENSQQYQEARTEAVLQLEQEIARINVEIAKTTDHQVRSALLNQRQALENRLRREQAKQN